MDYLDEQVGALDLNTSTDTILSEMGTNGTLYTYGMSEAEFKNNVKNFIILKMKHMLLLLM